MNYSYNNDMDIKETVGNDLRLARQAKGMTQKQVAAVLKKYQPDYSQYETGRTELDYEKIVAFCKLSDTTPNELFEGLF